MRCRSRAGTGGIGADVVHGDDIAFGTGDVDPVAAVAADHIGQLKADVQGRLEGKRGAWSNHQADDLIAIDRIAAGDARPGELG